MFFLSCVNISIGSLGNGDEMIHVQRIHVSHCSFVKTTNGARIKTWEVIFFFFFCKRKFHEDLKYEFAGRIWICERDHI